MHIHMQMKWNQQKNTLISEQKKNHNQIQNREHRARTLGRALCQEPCPQTRRTEAPTPRSAQPTRAGLWRGPRSHIGIPGEGSV